MLDQIELCGRNAALSFGPFELFPDRGLLFRSQQQIKIGSRAFALLSILLQHAGEIVAQTALIDHVWPNIFVHETNLKVTVSNLRRILGDDGPVPSYIMTVPGRGYRFVAQVARRPASIPELMPPASGDITDKSDMWLIIGRKTKLCDALAPWSGPMISFVIPNGEGGTEFAITAATQLLDSFPDRVCFIDLSATEKQLVPSFIAATLVSRGNIGSAIDQPKQHEPL